MAADVALLSEMLAVACGHGHLHIAEWLVGLDGVDIHAGGEHALRQACGKGHLHIAEWLVGLGGVDIHADGEGAFRWACGSGHLVVAQWLLGLGGVNIHAVSDYAFRWACNHGHLECARVLVGLDPEYAWPRVEMKVLEKWGDRRDAWLKAVVFAAGSRKESV